MTALLPILVAASLSSTDIKEFFTLPSWMPASVGSCDTPGSDPAGGGWLTGWYADAYTNKISHTDWRMCRPGTTNAIDNFQGPSFAYGTWHMDGVTPPSAITPEGYYFYTVSPDNQGDSFSENLKWRFIYLNSTNGEEKALAFVSRRNPVLTPVYAGVRPKAAHLTPEIQAGIMSAFAAYCERQYYASQGQVTRWDESVWGPTANKRKFRFAPEAHRYTTVTTNYTPWRAVTTYGTYAGLELDYNPWSPGFNITPIARKVADTLGVPYYTCDPAEFGENEWDLYISGNSAVLESRGGTRHPFTFSATRSLVGVTTNEVFDRGSEFLYEPTNRTVSTRRLVQYDNICELASFLLERHMAMSFTHTAPARPNWIAGTWIEGSVDFDATRMWWSTTDDSILSGSQIVPQFGWTSEPTRGCDWSNCAMTFECLSSDDVWARNASSCSARMTPTYVMMRNMGFRQSWYESSLSRTVQPTASETMTNLLASVYPHSSPCAITNRTRRLRSETLSTVNQTLGLMDRTYHVPEVIWSEYGTNVTYVHELVFYGSANGHLEWDSLNHEGKLVYESRPYAWYRYEEIATNVTSGLGVGFGGFCESVTAPTTDVDLSHTHDPTNRYVAAGGLVLSENMIAEYANDEGLGAGPLVVVVRPTYGEHGDQSLMYSIGVSNGTFYGETARTYQLTPSITNTSIPLIFRYRRKYHHAWSLSPTLGVSQPGGYVKGRAKSCAFGAVIGYIADDGGSTPILDEVENTSSSVIRYKSQTENYSVRYDLEVKLDSLVDELRNEFRIEFGDDFDGWESIIPIDDRDAIAVRDGVRVDESVVDFSPSQYGFVSCVVASDGSVTIDSCSSYGFNSDEYAGSSPPVLYTAAYGSPTCEFEVSPNPRSGSSMSFNGKIGIITRTDWDWHALKRTDD